MGTLLIGSLIAWWFYIHNGWWEQMGLHVKQTVTAQHCNATCINHVCQFNNLFVLGVCARDMAYFMCVVFHGFQMKVSTMWPHLLDYTSHVYTWKARIDTLQVVLSTKIWSNIICNLYYEDKDFIICVEFNLWRVLCLTTAVPSTFCALNFELTEYLHISADSQKD